MIKRLILLSAILAAAAVSPAFAQENNQTPKPAPSPTTETERPKTEVDKQLEESKKRGELVLATCLEDCDGEGESGDLERGQALELPKPEYPAIARRAHASGEVRVQVIVDVDGKIIAASAISGHPLLYGVAVNAARHARFSPTKFNGEAVKVTGVILYNFVAQ